jgi:hypothetical protein
MFGPDFTADCPSCSAIADGFDGSVAHLENHDVAFVAVSRAPVDKLTAYRRRMGSSFPWASSLDSDFNYDFNTSFTESRSPRRERTGGRAIHAGDVDAVVEVLRALLARQRSHRRPRPAGCPSAPRHQPTAVLRPSRTLT